MSAGFVGRQGSAAGSVGYYDELSPTLRSGITTDTVYKTGGAVAFDITGASSNSMKSPTPDSCFKQREICRTLDTFVGSPECNQGGMAVAEKAYGADCRNGMLNDELSGTLQAKPNGGFSYNCINPVIYQKKEKHETI